MTKCDVITFNNESRTAGKKSVSRELHNIWTQNLYSLLVTMCTNYQYVVSSISTVKNLLFDHQVTCGDPLSIQQQPFIQSTHSNEYQVCKSEVLQLPNGAEIFPRIVSDRKQGKPPITQQIIKCFGLHLVQARTDTWAPFCVQGVWL